VITSPEPTQLNQSINQRDDERRLRWASMSVSLSKLHINSTGQFSDHNDRLAVVTELTSWVESGRAMPISKTAVVSVTHGRSTSVAVGS